MYNKIFTKILDSSIWLEPNPTRIVWITMIAAMDEDGFVQFSSVGNLANRAVVSREEAEAAVKVLEGPDPDSNNKDYEGRRIERVPGGWMVLNANVYRDMVTRTEKLRLNRERVARHRAKKKGQEPAGNAVSNVPVMQSYSYSNAYSESESEDIDRPPAASKTDLALTEIKRLYPKRSGSQPWRRAEKAINARLADGASTDHMLEGTRRYAEFCQATGKVNTEFVMQASTFFGPDERYLEDWTLPATKAEVRLAGNLSAAEEFMRRTNGTQ